MNIVSFDVPFPPDFGGAVEVFYKLKALSEAGVKIYLHTFKAGRGRQSDLEKYCEQVFYYPRNKSFLNAIRLIPFIVISRKSNKLIENLNKSGAPVLFEGIHTTYPLASSRFKPLKTLVRMHNVEHEYYLRLCRTETGVVKRLYFWLESLRLKRYQKVLKKCDHILSISPSDQVYFDNIPGFRSTFVPSVRP